MAISCKNDEWQIDVCKACGLDALYYRPWQEHFLVIATDNAGQDAEFI